MTDQTKSLIRHILTALSGVLIAIGLTSAAGIINFTLGNLDAVWEAILVITGFVAGFKGFKFGRTAT